MLDYNKCCNNAFFENGIVDGKITPKMILDYVCNDTYWFMRGITEEEHRGLLKKMKSEDTIFIGKGR